MALKSFERRKDFKDVKHLLKQCKIGDFIEAPTIVAKKAGDQ